MPRIFVGNLPFNAQEAELRSRFERFGRVASVRIATDASSRSRGFGFVVMPSVDDADEAICRLSGTVMGGRRLNIDSSVDRRPNAGPPADDSARQGAIAFFDALMAD